MNAPPPPSDAEPAPNNRAMAIILVLVVALVAVAVGPLLMRERDQRQLLETGTDATAEIVSLEDTGDRMNENPIVQLDVMVHPEGGEPYKATIVTDLSVVDLQNYRVGVKVRVRYDDADPSKVALVGPLPAPASPPPSK
jgi:hypothetical protein